MPDFERLGSARQTVGSVRGGDSGSLDQGGRRRAGARRRRILPPGGRSSGVCGAGNRSFRKSSGRLGNGGARAKRSGSQLGYGGHHPQAGGWIPRNGSGEAGVNYFFFPPSPMSFMRRLT